MKILKGKSGEIISKVGGLGAGATAGNTLHTRLSKPKAEGGLLTTALNPKLAAAIVIGLGYFVSNMKQSMFKRIGEGMIAAGSARLVASFVPALSGSEAFDISNIGDIDDMLDNEDYSDAVLTGNMDNQGVVLTGNGVEEMAEFDAADIGSSGEYDFVAL